MTESLRRWAELEPERCRYFDGALGKSVQLRTGTRWESRNATSDLDELLEEALEEAISARNWKYTVNEQAPYEARMEPVGGEGMSVISPIRAVLNAYNDALGAQLQR